MLLKIAKMVNWRIINFLIEKDGASLSAIARETHTTKANVFHSLKELSSMDIVRKKIAGKTHLYRFNLFNSYSKNVLNTIEEERQEAYCRKFDNFPIILHSFLENVLKESYLGCIFFGSSLSGKYRDIDVFIILKEKKNIGAIGKKLRLMNKKISPIFGLDTELMEGLKNQDMLYRNIISGIPFGFDASELKYRELFLRKQDINERFIIGYREILSCLEFKEREYVKIHLDKGTTDLIYSILNYFDFFPKNDKEAISLFENKLKEQKPKTITKALQIVEKYAWTLN